MASPDDDFFDDTEPKTRLSIPKVKSVVATKKPFVLKMMEGPGAPKEFSLDRDKLTIGRAPGLEISIPSEQLSRTHARLSRHGHSFSCVDLDSRNGLYLNSVKVHSAVLSSGDTLQLGDVIFVYTEGT
jgi:pSer/pThr/pTyr-binding forkhead associated (FHA) protein